MKISTIQKFPAIWYMYSPLELASKQGRENDYIPAYGTKMRQYKLVWRAGQEGSGVMPIHHLFNRSEECKDRF